MEVKLGQLPEACNLTYSYQKHHSLYWFKPCVSVILLHFDIV